MRHLRRADTTREHTVLGFDFGTRHIGVAVGQSVTRTASPVGAVVVTGGRPDWAAIAGIVARWEPDALVVGEPLNMDGTEQAMTAAARRFGRRLAQRFGLPVHYADERLSSREARRRLAARGQRRRPDHAVAAQVILETWLDP